VDRLLAELSELLRIPSVAGDDVSLARAVGWVCSLVESAGGAVERERWSGVPLGVGRIPASVDPDAAPTILLYGHVDVQPIGRAVGWSSDPFDPTVRDGWLYARGAADDKGPFYALLRAACDLAAQRRLPSNVRVLCDTEEETGGDAARRFLARDPVPVDACAIFDAGLHVPFEPVLVLATRGIASMRVRVKVAEDDVHSGLYGGVAPNAAHVLIDALGAVVGRDGDLDPVLWAGVVEPVSDELRSWEQIDAAGMLSAAGVASDGDGIAALQRLWAEPAADVHGFSAGITERELNIVPAVAEAVLSVRVAPGQDVTELADAAEALLRDAVPTGVSLSVTALSRTAAAGPFDPSAPVIAAAREALGRAFGRPAVLARSGGSLPILAALSGRGVPTALTGLALPDSHIHGTDERLRVDHLELGVSAARELLLAWDDSVLRAGAVPPATSPPGR
jgi:acetylornithine deacetylase/succinyl-diaminopimelate desuccinylase-like protein